KYKGPSIKISDDYPSIDDTELDSITKIFKNSDAVTASDGYGNSITSSIETKYTITNSSATEVTIGFLVTNMFGDSASEVLKMELDRTGPLLVLTTDTEHVDLGANFEPVNYIASATDADGNDISTLVVTEGDLDTSTPGTYALTYKLTDADGNEATSRSLKITVD
ncbi:MAG: DUF5011 domain-containing protein, partial [Lachnospiraceae bacterium]|nr:DUF5011 domain-containing protein [Lachnospiraceae bacterium]